ncbi:MAG: hypothetical protein R2829_00300 [Bacteroidia bacterium]
MMRPHSIPENGCNSSTDLRDVPVVTDLTSENPDDAANFPLSTQALTKHLYASRYYMENNSKITIQNCVRLFDCTFDVKQGATLLFDDYPTHLGKEDHSYDRQDCRFKIQTLGGALLRNYADIQYLQNGNITQTYPLHYKAVSKIYAGNDVDLDSDVPKQDYVVNSGANVTFRLMMLFILNPDFMLSAEVSFMPLLLHQVLLLLHALLLLFLKEWLLQHKKKVNRCLNLR